LPAGKDILKKLARNEPYYKRNRPHLCSFYAKGECSRGSECPYRHEKPDAGQTSSHQNIRDRYHGNNDPVAMKMLASVGATGAGGNGIGLKPDNISTSLFLNGVHKGISEQDLREFFYAFGEIKSIVVVHKANCAFINYTTRTSAERAMDRVMHGIEIKGTLLHVQWGK
jgi:pre-mRNA-splicing factor RBM22/SLT11